MIELEQEKLTINRDRKLCDEQKINKQSREEKRDEFFKKTQKKQRNKFPRKNDEGTWGREPPEKDYTEYDDYRTSMEKPRRPEKTTKPKTQVLVVGVGVAGGRKSGGVGIKVGVIRM